MFQTRQIDCRRPLTTKEINRIENIRIELCK